MNSLSTQQMGKLGFFGVARTVAAKVVLAGLIAGLAACAAFDRRPPQEIVKERAQARWDALVKGEVPVAYGYFSPTSRSLVTLEAYKDSIKPGFWKAVAVDKVDCPTPESCDVIVTIEYEFRGSRLKTPLRESWIREGPNWWYVHK